MAFGANSFIFQQAMVNPIALGANATTGFPTSFAGLVADTVNVALYGNSGTPDKATAVTSTAYNTGQWVTGNEVTGTGYTAGGTALTSKAYGLNSGSSSMIFGAANPSWTGATITAYGDLVYDNTISGGTVAKQGMCFHSFGGSAQTVSGGTFTILWATPVGAGATAVFNITV